MNCEALLLLPHLRVQNANAIAGPLSWGFPAVTAFTGFVHALQRRLQAEALDIELDGVAIVCHHFEAQTSLPAGKRTHVFHLTRNPVNADGSTAAIVEEGRAHLEVSLLIGVNGDCLYDEAIRQGLAARILQAALSMRLAGGSLLPSAQRAQLLERTGSDEGDEKQLRMLRRRLLPGFALVGRRDLLTEHTAQLQAADPQADTLDALLDLTRLNIDPPQADAEQDSPAAGWHVRPRGGWLVPIPVGYRALGDVQPAGSVRNARDRDTPFCFVESLYSLGQWLSPHRVRDLSELFWYHRADPDAGLYLCETTDYLPQDSE
ncbi:type I-F CRISPR-associated protein Csy2 [Pseudomonas stutzeri]|nr:type I-F CRISPR-associated protein Csy2 [Stutzerimonas stutzeri]